MRSLLGSSLGAVALFGIVSACGGRAIDPGGDPGASDASTSADASRCPRERPHRVCSNSCGGVVDLVCNVDHWECPTSMGGSGGCVGPTDAGACGPAPDIACPVGCNGEYGGPECTDGTWQCPPLPPCPPPPPPDAGVVACGDTLCNANTSYCESDIGGPPPLDGGGAVAFNQCKELPPTCSSGTLATCACVMKGNNGPCKCTEEDGQVTVMCFLP